MSLNAKAWVAVVALAAVMGLLIFGAAGTISYWQGWAYLAVFTSASVLMTGYLMKRDPALLERRMTGGPTAEKRPTQRLIMWFASIGFIALIVVPPIEYRLHGSSLPPSVNLIGDVLVAIGFFLIFFVYRENTFTSATIELAENQRVISTGPYAIVRHPIYSGFIVATLGTAIAHGDVAGLVATALVTICWASKARLEESFMIEKFGAEYEDYRRHVKGLIPGVW